MRRGILFVLFIGLFFVACNNDDDTTSAEQQMIDQGIITEYLADNGLATDAIEHESGIHYILDDPGSGDEHPNDDSVVEVKYKGYFTDGTVFDQTSGDNSIVFALNGVIEGWRICVPLLKIGGSGTFLLPSHLAYGNNPPPGIPRNAVLIFDIELVDFN